MQVKILNRQQTAHKCIHLTTCVQLRGKKFAMLSISRVYLSYVSIACPLYARLYFVISFDLKCTANKWVQGYRHSAKGEMQAHIIRDLQILQFCRIQKHLEIEYRNII